jgi:hypothetical protein
MPKKYFVQCSRRCIVITIDGASYDVDVDVPNDSHENTLKILFQKDNCIREEVEFKVISGCAEGFVSKTMTVSCE